MHLARTQALTGKVEQAVGTLKQNKEPEPHPAAQMHRALYESPPTAEKPCPKQLLDASEAVTACVAEAVKAGPGIPNSPLSGAICHVFNVDLVRAACALAQAHNSAGRFAEAKALMSGLAETVPKARDRGTVAYQELRLAAAQAQEALLVSLAGLKEAEAAAPLYEAVYPVLSDNQRWTLPEIEKLITVCKVGAEVCPLLAAAHSRLAAAEFLRADYDPAMSKPSAKDAKKEALERCVKLLRAGLALEGKPSRGPSKSPPPAPAPAPAPALRARCARGACHAPGNLGAPAAREGPGGTCHKGKGGSGSRGKDASRSCREGRCRENRRRDRISTRGGNGGSRKGSRKASGVSHVSLIPSHRRVQDRHQHLARRGSRQQSRGRRRFLPRQGRSQQPVRIDCSSKASGRKSGAGCKGASITISPGQGGGDEGEGRGAEDTCCCCPCCTSGAPGSGSSPEARVDPQQPQACPDAH